MQYNGIISRDRDEAGRYVVYANLGDCSQVFSFDHDPTDQEVQDTANNLIAAITAQQQADTAAQQAAAEEQVANVYLAGSLN